MKTVTRILALSLALGLPTAGANEPVVAKATQAPVVNPAQREVIDVVERFGSALKAGDMPGITRMLDEAVLILESGGAEQPRAEYLGHHAIADAAFLKGVTTTLKARRAQVSGDTAWVGSETELDTGQGPGAKTLLSTETMVLRRQDADWNIVHIHWSSRPKKGGAT